jgi:hypothetical protein
MSSCLPLVTQFGLGVSFSVPMSTATFSTSDGKLIFTEKAINILCYCVFVTFKKAMKDELDPASGASSYDAPASANFRNMSTYASESKAKRNPP